MTEHQGRNKAPFSLHPLLSKSPENRKQIYDVFSATHSFCQIQSTII